MIYLLLFFQQQSFFDKLDSIQPPPVVVEEPAQPVSDADIPDLRRVTCTIENPVASAPSRIVVMTSARYCGPCQRAKKDLTDLIKAGLLVVVETDQPGADYSQYGISPSVLTPTPRFFIFDTVTGLHKVGGDPCTLTGYPNRDEVLRWMALPTHDVRLPVVSPKSDAVYEMEGPPSVDSLLSVLTHHVSEEPVGGLFDIEIDGPDNLRDSLAELLQKKSFTRSGVTIQWEGSRSISLDDGVVTVKPAIQITGTKSVLTVRTELSRLTFNPSLTEIKLYLSGPVPDITVRWK